LGEAGDGSRNAGEIRDGAASSPERRHPVVRGEGWTIGIEWVLIVVHTRAKWAARAMPAHDAAKRGRRGTRRRCSQGKSGSGSCPHVVVQAWHV
jgi:hypothetical protein